ncbi:hypothetical protein AAHH78_36990, partial [Burkholderia pseudomallei]
MSRFDKGMKNVIALVPRHVYRKICKRISEKNEELISESFDVKLLTEGNGRLSDICEDYESRLTCHNNEQLAKGR